MVEGSDDEVAATVVDEAPAPRKYFTRAEVREARDREPIEVEVQEWGGWVRIIPMTSVMRQELEDRVEDKYKELPGGKRVKIANHDAKVWRERMVADCCVDDEGLPLFKPADINWLQEKNARAVAIISTQILRISGVSPEEQEAIQKNSERARSADG